MSSLPATIVYGSYQSATNVIDAVQSYRRTQAHYSDFVSGSLSSSSETHDLEAALDDDQGDLPQTDEPYPSVAEGPTFSHLSWDEDLTPRDLEPRHFQSRTAAPSGTQSRWPSHLDQDDILTPRPNLRERTPLLVRPTPLSPGPSLTPQAADPDRVPQYAATHRRVSVSSTQPKSAAKYHRDGQSTYIQTMINAVAVLFGIGMLSEPLAFAYAGWIGGTILIIAYGLISCYTAKILARIVLQDPSIRSYADIGRKAFGPRSGPLISTIFGLELFTVSVALVTLYADSLYAVSPRYSADTYKLLGLVILVPAVLMPLSVLSYASIVGIFSLMGIIGIVLFDGFTKPDSPGSLWSPADTSLGIVNFKELGVAFGLFMAGFSGHAVIPTLAKDMIDPTRFDEMINWAFAIATGIYGLLGAAGYIMFGSSVSDEFSQDLVKHNVHPALNTVALWGLVITPLTKYALTARPLSVTIEILLGIDTSSASTSDHGPAPNPSPSPAHAPHLDKNQNAASAKVNAKTLRVALERTALTLLSVGVSIVVPEFAPVMAVLGSTFSFVLCIIGPVCAKLALQDGSGGGERGWDGQKVGDVLLVGVSAGMAVWGTVCAVEGAMTGV